MKQLTINIQDNKYNFLLELLSSFEFVKIKKNRTIKISKEKQEFIEDFKNSLKEVELHEQGKIKLKTIDQLLDEL